MDQKDILLLLERYKAGQCTAEEAALLEGWYLSQSRKSSTLSTAEVASIEQQLWTGLERHIGEVPGSVNKPLKLWQRVSWAAAVLLTVSSGLFFYLSKPGHSSDLAQAEHILPGTNTAVLTLADGKKINLNDVSIGKLAEESGIVVKKAADGQLVYSIDPKVADQQQAGLGKSSAALNTISTPKAGQYQLNLPDGTKVWLNAASSLKFPSSFAGLNQRRVSLNGEAYFEVSKNKKLPFIVETDKQAVEVLGTHFNVNSYKDEPQTKTTLLEGSVRVSLSKGKEVVLKPGQQSALNLNNQISVTDADVEEAVAWRKGFFQFDNASIETVLRQLARWYDVEVEYEKGMPNKNFTGKIYRNLTLAEALRGIGFTGVNFKVKDRTIIIAK